MQRLTILPVNLIATENIALYTIVTINLQQHTIKFISLYHIVYPKTVIDFCEIDKFAQNLIMLPQRTYLYRQNIAI